VIFMADFVEEFLQDYGRDVSKQASSNLGIKQDVILQMIPVVAPMILAGLKKQMSQHGGSDQNARADRVDHILNKYGKASVLSDVDKELATRAKEKKPDPRLGGLLGESGVQAADMMSNRFNIDKGMAMKLIVMLAPLILGALTNKRDKGGVGTRGIASLIDQDGDDQIIDDVAGMLFKSLDSSRSSSGGGILGSLLSEVMQPRCQKCGSATESKMKYCSECGSRL
jgi:hypothetical protein